MAPVLTPSALRRTGFRFWFARGLFFIGAGLLALAVLVGLALWMADRSVRDEVVTAAPATLAREAVSIQADERLFTLMAALNAAGYDDENNEKGMSPLRKQVRAQLAQRNIPSLSRLRLYFQAHPSQYVAWVLGRGDAPQFGRASPDWAARGLPAFMFWGLAGALGDFHREAGIAELWQESRPEYEKEVARYRPLAQASVTRALGYLRVAETAAGPVVVLPNLLDAYWRGYGPRVGNISYVVVGPAETPNLGLIQHEALHPIINRWVHMNLQVIEPPQAQRLYQELKPKMASGYGEWETILSESVIRAVGVRLLPPAARTDALARDEAQGFMLVRPLALELVRYEQSQQSFSDFLPTLLGSLNRLNTPDF